jgi:hypothetical protein
MSHQDIKRQEIGALADADGRIVAHLFYNTSAGAIATVPGDHSGWFRSLDHDAARSSVQYLARQNHTAYFLARQYSIATPLLFQEPVKQ